MSNINLDYAVYNLNSKESGVQTFTYKDIGTSNIRYEIISGNTYIYDKNTSNINDQAIKNSLNNIFNFLPGQEILDPLFGNNLYNYLYEPMNNFTADKIGKTIRSMIGSYEPRVSISDIEIKPNAEDMSYNIIIQYSIDKLGVDSSLILNMSINNGISTS